MKRSPMPPSTKRLKSTRLRPKKRSAAEREEKFWREYGGEERAAWIRGHRCLVGCSGPSVNAHTRHPSSGVGYKGDCEAVVPLCWAHEHEKHQHGEDTFNAKYQRELYGRTLAQWAEVFASAWRNHGGLTPVALIAPSVVARLMDRAKESA